MDLPVAMKSNLHSVLFAPASTRFWVANASKDGQPAVTQPYRGFQLTELLTRVPDSSAPSCPGPANPPERHRPNPWADRRNNRALLANTLPTWAVFFSPRRAAPGGPLRHRSRRPDT